MAKQHLEDDAAHNSPLHLVHLAPDVPQEGFSPTPYERFKGWFTGADFLDHYTRPDVRSINNFAPLTWLSVSMATLGTSLALMTYLGIPMLLSAIPFALGYTFLDRTIIHGENREKADRTYEKLVTPASRRSLLKDIKKQMSRLVPLSIRMGMAVCTSIITGGIIVSRMASNEIDTMAQDAFQRKNSGLLAEKTRKETEYDKRIASLQDRIDGLRSGLTTAASEKVDFQRAPADQAQFDAASEQITVLQRKLDAEQSQLVINQKKMTAEGAGVGVYGASGKFGEGPRWDAAKIEVNGNQLAINQLNSQLQAQRDILNKIAQRDNTSMTAARERAALTSQGLASARTDQLTVTQAELKALKDGRGQAFKRIDAELTGNPEYKPKQNETGIFNDMKNLQLFLNASDTGVVAKGFAITTEIFVFLLEMAAIMGAMARKSTPSELWDARKRAESEGNIKRNTYTDLEDIYRRDAHLESVAEHTASGSYVYDGKFDRRRPQVVTSADAVPHTAPRAATPMPAARSSRAASPDPVVASVAPPAATRAIYVDAVPELKFPTVEDPFAGPTAGSVSPLPDKPVRGDAQYGRMNSDPHRPR